MGLSQDRIAFFPHLPCPSLFSFLDHSSLATLEITFLLAAYLRLGADLRLMSLLCLQNGKSAECAVHIVHLIPLCPVCSILLFSYFPILLILLLQPEWMAGVAQKLISDPQ